MSSLSNYLVGVTWLAFGSLLGVSFSCLLYGLPFDRSCLDVTSDGKNDFPRGRNFTVCGFFLDNLLSPLVRRCWSSETAFSLRLHCNHQMCPKNSNWHLWPCLFGLSCTHLSAFGREVPSWSFSVGRWTFESASDVVLLHTLLVSASGSKLCTKGGRKRTMRVKNRICPKRGVVQ